MPRARPGPGLIPDIHHPVTQPSRPLSKALLDSPEDDRNAPTRPGREPASVSGPGEMRLSIDNLREASAQEWIEDGVRHHFEEMARLAPGVPCPIAAGSRQPAM